MRPGIWSDDVGGAYLDIQAGRESVVILRVIHTSGDWPAGGWPQ